MKKLFTFLLAPLIAATLLLSTSTGFTSQDASEIKQLEKSQIIKYYQNKACSLHEITESKCYSYAKIIYDQSTAGPIPHYVLFATLWQESRFRNVVGDRRNQHKAYGLGQLQERTAEYMLGRNLKKNFGGTGHHELVINYPLNIKLTYKNILRHYRHHNNNLNIALRAYNGGRGNIQYRDTKVYASEVEEKIDYIQQELTKLVLR